MNYLKSITSTVLNSTGVSFPFSIGERIPGLESGSSIWDLREGIKKDDGTPLTLFIFDGTLPPLQPGNKDRRTLMQLARNSLKKLRTIRHPDVIKYIDSVETDTHVYIATERVRPLNGVLRDWETGGSLGGSKGKGRENWVGWGIRSIATALAFLNAAPLSLHHAYLIPSSIFVTPAMECRLGGFDLLTGRDDSAGVLWGLGGIAPGDVGEWSGPEVRKGGWTALRDMDPSQSDIYIFALLIFVLYNPNSPLPSLSQQPSPSSAGSIPRSLFPIWKRMLNPNPRARLSTTSFLSEASTSGFWVDNPLTSLVAELDGFELKSEGEKIGILRTIKDSISSGSLPNPFLLYRVLPSLLHSISLPTAPSGAMLPIVLELGKLVVPTDYPKMVLDPVVKLFASPDRGTRMALLDGLSEYADKLDQKVVSERIWPHFITGFADTVPVIREATVKAVYTLSSKFTDRILNNDLLRLLAKTQTDTEPSIRTNTCILLGRLAPILGPNTKKKVLVPAFARSLKDPFVHARVAGLMAFMATVDCFDRDDLASKVIPNMAFSMVDKEKLVRDQAFKAMNMFMKRIEDGVSSMPDTVLSEDRSAFGPTTTSQANNSSTQTGYVNSAAGAAGALAGWAISSLSKQLASTEIHSTLSAQPSNLVPPSISPSFVTPTSSAPESPRLSSDSASIFGSTSTAAQGSKLNGFGAVNKSGFGKASSLGQGGMKLGGSSSTKANNAKKNNLADTLAGEWEDGVENAWGNDDLMDVNADDDDWAAFESAPIPEIVVPAAQSYYITPQPNGSSKPSPATSPVKPKPQPSKSPVPTPAIPSIPSKPATPVLPDTASDGWDEKPDSKGNSPKAPAAAAPPSMANMSKEEKDKEMARRRDERKARIAAMKEQKKGKT